MITSIIILLHLSFSFISLISYWKHCRNETLDISRTVILSLIVFFDSALLKQCSIFYRFL